MVDFINRSWPSLFGTDVRKVSERDCSEWLVRFQKQYAPSVVNNAIGTLRSVFAEAVTSGARFGNPAANLSRMRIRAKQLELPSREQFLRFVEEIRTAGARQSKDCANLVRFLAYSGLRLGEAKFVAWSDVQFRSPPTLRSRASDHRDERRRDALCPHDSRAGKNVNRTAEGAFRRTVERERHAGFRVPEQHDTCGGENRDEANHTSRLAPFVRDHLHRERRGYSHCLALAWPQRWRCALHENLWTPAAGSQPGSSPARQLRRRELE